MEGMNSLIEKLRKILPSKLLDPCDSSYSFEKLTDSVKSLNTAKVIFIMLEAIVRRTYCLDGMRTTLVRWHGTAISLLSLLGRIVLSQLWYTVAVVSIPNIAVDNN